MCVKGWSQQWLLGVHSQFHWVYLVWLHANYMHWALWVGSSPKTQLVGLSWSWLLSRVILCHSLFARRSHLEVNFSVLTTSYEVSVKQVYFYLYVGKYRTSKKKKNHTLGVAGSQITYVDLVFHRGQEQEVHWRNANSTHTFWAHRKKFSVLGVKLKFVLVVAE